MKTSRSRSWYLMARLTHRPQAKQHLNVAAVRGIWRANLTVASLLSVALAASTAVAQSTDSSTPNLGSAQPRLTLPSSTATTALTTGEMLDSPLRYLVRLSAQPQIVGAYGTRGLDIQFEGEVPQLAQQRKQLSVVIRMAYADGAPLQDRNKVAAIDDVVGTEIPLSEGDIEIRGDTFRAAMFFPLNDLDLIGDNETPLQVELQLRRGKQVITRNPFVPEKYEFFTIKSEDMPRMWVQSLKVEAAKNADGQPGVSANGLIYIAGPEGAETTVEMALADAKLEGIPSRDPRFRVTDSWAGQGQRVKPTKNVQSFRVTLFTPFDACQLQRGQQEISVYLRAFDRQGKYIGGTPPEPLQVNVP